MIKTKIMNEFGNESYLTNPNWNPEHFDFKPKFIVFKHKERYRETVIIKNMVIELNYN